MPIARFRSPLFRSILGVAAMATLTGCSVSSADLDTDSMWADIGVSATGSGSSNVSVTLRRGLLSTTFIDLTDDDVLTATNNDTTQEMQALRLLGLVSYSTSFDVDEGGEQFEVTLTRDRDDGAPSSMVTLPDRFALDPLNDPSPDEAGLSRENDAIVVSWIPEGDSGTYSISVSGDCIDTFETSAPADATTVTIEAGSLVKRQPEEPEEGEEGEEAEEVPDTCDATINVSRSLTGDLDLAWMGGLISGSQRRSTSFNTTL